MVEENLTLDSGRNGTTFPYMSGAFYTMRKDIPTIPTCLEKEFWKWNTSRALRTSWRGSLRSPIHIQTFTYLAKYTMSSTSSVRLVDTVCQRSGDWACAGEKTDMNHCTQKSNITSPGYRYPVISKGFFYKTTYSIHYYAQIRQL